MHQIDKEDRGKCQMHWVGGNKEMGEREEKIEFDLRVAQRNTSRQAQWRIHHAGKSSHLADQQSSLKAREAKRHASIMLHKADAQPVCKSQPIALQAHNHVSAKLHKADT
ncbi:hypothetical protein PoB_005562800 [Plakobranchus ocellatus]|uniref:Uncharacterized protein n=1 Tax=Plakobranchus ocellatus TaxID=259542 RepID=A0AAV4CB88_9GAST|nr:hypothetical protein PoB_005562800 [Plakobranchus ocellatus]